MSLKVATLLSNSLHVIGNSCDDDDTCKVVGKNEKEKKMPLVFSNGGNRFTFFPFPHNHVYHMPQKAYI